MTELSDAVEAVEEFPARSETALAARLGMMVPSPVTALAVNLKLVSSPQLAMVHVRVVAPPVPEFVISLVVSVEALIASEKVTL